MNFAQKYNDIAGEIQSICHNQNHVSMPVIIAVSKYHPYETVKMALEQGIRIFGESKIQEGIEKFSRLRQAGFSFELHHIGPLQRGNARKIPGFFDYVHGAQSAGAIEELARHCLNKQQLVRIFLQLNLTGEEAKNGMSKQQCLDLLQNRQAYENDFCQISGLMAMGPSNGDPALTTAVFRELAAIRDSSFISGKLSMGMSGDYRSAVAAGSDYIRIGTAIFGERT